MNYSERDRHTFKANDSERGRTQQPYRIYKRLMFC